jgi:uncharacterized DUF497 family protein
MDITYDTAKNETNTEKHGVALAAAVDFEWDDALFEADERKNYGEDRQRAIGYIGERLYVVVYVDRDEARRIISLRKANSREVKHYAKA